jgi:hypothetical protein
MANVNKRFRKNFEWTRKPLFPPFPNNIKAIPIKDDIFKPRKDR